MSSARRRARKSRNRLTKLFAEKFRSDRKSVLFRPVDSSFPEAKLVTIPLRLSDRLCPACGQPLLTPAPT